MKRLQIVKNALLSVTKAVYHYEAPKDVTDYIVWAEESESNSVEADNCKIEQSISGTVSFYTKKECHPFTEEIQKAFVASKISFKLALIEYDPDTELIHYEWDFEV